MKRLTRIFLLVILFSIIAVSGRAAEDQVLTLKACIRIGLEQNLQLKASHAVIDRAKYSSKAAYADFFPKLKLQGTYRWLDNPVSIDIPEITIHTPMGAIVSPQTTVSEAARNSGILTTSVIQPLFTGGALTARYTLARLEEKSRKNTYKANRQTLIENIKFAYFNLIKTLKIHTLTIKFTEQLQSHLKTAKAFLDENIIPLNDYLQTKVTLSNARLNVIKAKNAQKVAQSYLNLLLNRNLNLSIRPETDFTIQKLTKPLLFYQNKAVTLRPDLKVAITRVKQARSSIRLAQSSYYPQVALSVNYRDLSDESLENDSTSVLVTANWSIFEWNKRKWEVSAEKAQLEQAILMEGQLKQEILHEVKTAYLNLLESLKRIQTIKDSVKQARENMRINTLRYKEQVATSTDVIDAQTLLLRTEVNLTVARIDYLKALAGLEKAIGQSLPEDSL